MLVLRLPLDTGLAVYCELRPEIQRWHNASDSVEAEHSAVAYGHADVSALQEPLHGIGLASCGLHAKRRLGLAGVFAGIETSLVCPFEIVEGYDVYSGRAEQGELQIVRHDELIVRSVASPKS